ncbi:putative PurR-regulated permease PerM [Paraburkholderia sp. GAS448]
MTVVILLQRDDLRDRAIRLFGSGDLHRTMTLMDEAARRLSRYFVSQLGVNAGVGFEIGTGLFFIGVPSPLLWGILAALLQHVPIRRHLDRGRARDGAGRRGEPRVAGGRHGQVE